MGFSPVQLVKNWFKTIYIVRFPLIAIVLMLSLATLTGTSGIQGTLGLAFAATGKLFPFFSAVLGWLGVAATGRTPRPMCCSAAFRWWRPIMPASIRC